MTKLLLTLAQALRTLRRESAREKEREGERGREGGREGVSTTTRLIENYIHYCQIPTLAQIRRNKLGLV